MAAGRSLSAAAAEATETATHQLRQLIARTEDCGTLYILGWGVYAYEYDTRLALNNTD